MSLSNKTFLFVIVNTDIKIAHAMARGESVKYRKCDRCGQHNENIMDSVCFECREFEYQLNLGE